MVTDGRRLYWCASCGAYRMSGGKTSGAFGHAYLFELRQLVQELDIVVPDPGSEHGRAVVAALGASIEPTPG